MTERATTTTTILFSDLVDSTPLLERRGDEGAKRVIDAHHRLLRDAVSANAGEEVKWTGDGLMVAFGSAADAVRCAISMQQTARHPARGERLKMRVGLNVGEVLRKDEDDYFGTTVVVAQRLCARAEDGQIICSALVAGLLAGRQAFRFRDLGLLDLKGIATPVGASEVLYGREQPSPLLSRPRLSQTPFVGREAEIVRLQTKLRDATGGHGGLAMLVGEPGIGKTRTIEEFADLARDEGASVLWGRNFEGEWQPPYGPFADALAAHFKDANADELLADLSFGAAPLARLVPSLRERFPDIPEPDALQPDEERFRLFDAVAQFLIAASRRTPIMFVLDDLQWADLGTIGLLQHVARFVRVNRILLVGAYRDVELDRLHPLADALAALRREADYDRMLLKGLDEDDVGRLLSIISEDDVPEVFVKAISDETDGNPFFIREVLLHLVEEGKIYRQDGQWKSPNVSIAQMGIPEGVRQVIGRRLSRLSDDANKLLSAASALNGAFRIDLVAGVAGLDERAALDAVDEALAAVLLRSAGDPDACDFTHALIRHTLYAELSPPRQVRLHRAVAETMERVYADRARAHAAEIAYHYHRSATLPGAERGVVHALAAADQHESAYAWDEAVTFLRIALELLPEEDTQRPRALGRLGIALAWSLSFDDALECAADAGEGLATLEGSDAAASYLATAAVAMREAGFPRGSWALAEQGMRFVGERKDATWLQLHVCVLARKEAQDADNPGMALDTDERRELVRVAAALGYSAAENPFPARVTSRQDALSRANEGRRGVTFDIGDYRAGLEFALERARDSERRGAVAVAAAVWAEVARTYNALGDLAAARDAYVHGTSLGARLSGFPSAQLMMLSAARYELGLVLDDGIERVLGATERVLMQARAETTWAAAPFRVAAALQSARLGRRDEALRWLATIAIAVERAPSGQNYTALACDAAEALWLIKCTDHIEAIERGVRDKVVAPDFRYPTRDGRLSMARLCALQHRYDEATDWFAQARVVLDEQGARPLRAIADYDEALMYARRSASGDRERARPLLGAALAQFREIGMTGWITRGEALSEELARPAT